MEKRFSSLALFLFALSMALLGALTFSLLKEAQASEKHRFVLNAEIDRLQNELRKKDAQISRLNQSLETSQRSNDQLSQMAKSIADPKSAPASVGEHSQSSSPVEKTAVPEDEAQVVQRRVQSVKKFLSLSVDEEEKLKVHFQKERGNGMPETLAKTIEEELGKEKAAAYREQVQGAFQKADAENDDKEVVYLSRQLGLSPEQEAKIRAIYSESQMATDTLDGQGEKDSSGWLQAYLKNLKTRRDQINAKISGVLTAQQNEAYLQYQAQSQEQDLHLMHE